MSISWLSPVHQAQHPDTRACVQTPRHSDTCTHTHTDTHAYTNINTSCPQASQLLNAVSGQLQSAAALLVELARAASASSVEMHGSNPLLTANTAAVLQQEEQQQQGAARGGGAGRLAPAFPTLYPQLPPGMAGDRTGAAAGGAGGLWAGFLDLSVDVELRSCKLP